jgi:ABC-type nitrate/sulfonate/bicarbonate transport system substrate-binding protein
VAPLTLHYTRCPVPTATGIAVACRIFDPLYADGRYRLDDIDTLGPAGADAHYTHSLDFCFREGGGGPPLWARANGADTRLIGITLMEELLGIYVRADDPATTVGDLAGRRVGLPVFPTLVFDFWRFAARKGFHSALGRHGLSMADVRAVDVVEDGARAAWRVGSLRAGGSGPPVHGYSGQLRELLAGRVDAVFGKGAEAAVLEREGGGRIRLLYDLRTSPAIADRVNNSTPRLVTASARLVRGEPEAAIRYLQGLVRASRWARKHPVAAGAVVAGDCGIAPEDVVHCFEPEFAARFAPALSPGLIAAVATLQACLGACGELSRDFPLDAWIDAGPLAEALAREGSGTDLGPAAAAR